MSSRRGRWSVKLPPRRAGIGVVIGIVVGA